MFVPQKRIQNHALFQRESVVRTLGRPLPRVDENIVAANRLFRQRSYMDLSNRIFEQNAENPIFFNQVIDDVVLMLIHPSGNAGDEK
jgi:hypothetical protein